MLHAVFVRSPVAHARIRAVDLTRAAAAPGVVFALDRRRARATAAAGAGHAAVAAAANGRAQVQHKFINPQQPLLAHDKVRHVGEAFAVIVAESRYAAEDAAALVSSISSRCRRVVDPEAALRAGAPVVHDDSAPT